MEYFTRYTVKKGDTRWGLSERYLGSPTDWWRIYSLNNQTRIVTMNGRGIDNPDKIYVGQKLLIPKTFRRPMGWASPELPASEAGQPGKLNEAISSITVPVVVQREIGGSGRSLNPRTETPSYWPKAKFEHDEKILEMREPGFTVTIKFRGQVLIQTAHAVPLTMIGRSIELARETEADHVCDWLTSEWKVRWDTKSEDVQFTCNMLKVAIAPGVPKVAVGWVASSQKPVIALHVEIEYPQVSGNYQGNYFYAVNFKIIADLEPDAPPKDTTGKRLHEPFAIKAVEAATLTGLAVTAGRAMASAWTYLFSTAASTGTIPVPLILPSNVMQPPET